VTLPTPSGALPPNPIPFAGITEVHRGKSFEIGQKCRVHQLARRKQKSGQTEVTAQQAAIFGNEKINNTPV
jgi:hypothetical protein